MKKKQSNTTKKSNTLLQYVNGNMIIKPINCELNENMKVYIEILEWNKQAFDKYTKKLFNVEKEKDF